MMNSALSLEEQRNAVEGQLDDQYQRGLLVDESFIVDGVGFGYGGVKRQIPHMAPATLAELARQLNAIEDKAIKADRLRREEQEREDARARAAEAPDPLEGVWREAAEHARQVAEREATVEGKLDKLIAINERIAQALERRG